MAVRLKLDSITDEQKKTIVKLLCLQPKASGHFAKQQFMKPKDPIMLYYVDKPKNEIVLPYIFANTLSGYHVNSQKSYPIAKYNFLNTTLREHQIPIVNEAMNHLNTFGTTLIGAPPGAGKTLMSAWLASQLGGLVLVLSPLTLVKKGWLTTFQEYTDAKIWNNDGKNSCPSSCNVILSMHTMFHKIPKEILEMVHVLIIDEAHMFCTADRIHCLLGTTPRYVIGCTATPTRVDGMESIIHSVCGQHGIFIKPTKKYTVYKLLTGIDVEIEQTSNGNANWAKLIKDLTTNSDRNAMILDLVKNNPTFKIMILTWSRDHAYFLSEMFNKNGITSDVLAGKKNSYNDTRVLVASYSKSGVGFDESVVCTDWDGIRLNMLFLTGSTKNVNSLCQFVGRIFRADHPIIIDFVDDNRIAKRHWNERRKWYEDPEQNGEIIEISYKKEQNEEHEMNQQRVEEMQKEAVARARLKLCK